MPKLVMLAAALLAIATSGAQDTSALARSLTFEVEHPAGSPAGWTIAPAGLAFADDKVVRTGRWSARIEGAGAAAATTVMSRTVPLDVAGKSIMLRAFVRTENVADFVSLWIRVADGSQMNLAFNSTQNRQVKGTQDWHEHSLTVPLDPQARQLVFGVVLSGSGRVWADDFELLVDGQPFSSAPKVERPKTIIDTDQEFDGGSRVAFEALTPAQTENLTTLGKIWGFLKYHHPAIRSGTRHWDYELLRVLPSVLAARDRASANGLMAKWVTSLGTVTPCKDCAAVKPETLHFGPNLAWLSDEARLGADLSRQLRAVHAGRPGTGAHFYLSLVPGVFNPTFTNEPNYAKVALPDAGFQLLAVYRFWNIIEYWFPYRDLIGENWDGVLREFIPRVATARSAPEYQRQLLGLIARVHDTHANLWSSLGVRPPTGACALPITLRFVEGRAVVTQGADRFDRGDVITALDNVPVAQLIKEWSPYYAASNEPTRLRDIAVNMTRGACGEATVSVTKPSGDEVIKAVRLPAKAAALPTHDLPGDTFRKLSDEVAYLKLSSIRAADVPGYIKAATGTKGLVIDIRNYPSAFVVFALGQALVADVAPFARFTMGDLVNPGAFHFGAMTSLKPATDRYTGQVVILVDEVSQSQSEYTAMAFRTAPGAKVVGSTTAGADGNVSGIPLPGGLGSMISGIGVFYPDKRPTQRIGIVPDVEVRPTIAGIRAGRDEVLEAGIRIIVGPAVPLVEIQRMIAAAR